jgi:hypothetical protein
MNELHGVIDVPEEGLPSLKRQLLLFDKLHLAGYWDIVNDLDELEFLK